MKNSLQLMFSAQEEAGETGVENGEENHAAKYKPCEEILTSGEKYKAKTPIPQEKLRVVK